jgi:hypothetical protein
MALPGSQRSVLTARIEEVSEPSHTPLRNLSSYWHSKKGTGIAPPRSAIKPEEIRAALPNIALLDVVGDQPRFRVRLFGTGLVDAYGEDITGRFLDEVDLDGIAKEIDAQVGKIVRECRVQVVRARFTKQNGARFLEYERIGFPLSADGATVNMLMFGFVVEAAFEN